MKIVIVEDEALVARRIERMTKEILGKKITSLTTKKSFQQASEYLFSHPADLLLLDLNLHGKDGFLLLNQAVSGAFHTIVITANTDRAMEAFELGVLDFIAKPFTHERLTKAFERFENVELRSVFPSQYLSIRKSNKLLLIPIQDIIYIKGAGIYSELHMDKGRTEFHDKTLNRLEKILPSHYVRVHKSYIVNIQLVEFIRNNGSGSYEVILTHGESLPVGRTKYKELKNILG